MLTLICGIPNAGKTTYSSRYENVIHMDEVIPKKRGLAYEEVCDMISHNDDVCVEGVFVAARTRRKLCEAHDGKKVCIWLNTPIEECIAREDRGRGTGIIRSCADFFEEPTLDEGWDEIIIIRGNNEQRYSRQE